MLYEFNFHLEFSKSGQASVLYRSMIVKKINLKLNELIEFKLTEQTQSIVAIRFTNRIAVVVFS